MFHEKLYYLEQLKKGPESHRRIMNRMLPKFQISCSQVRDELINDGLIVLHNSNRIGATQKMNHFYKLTNKKFTEVEPAKSAVAAKKLSDTWEDGTPKSKNNAFNWQNSNKSMFDNREVARMTQKYHNNHPITIYSRA